MRWTCYWTTSTRANTRHRTECFRQEGASSGVRRPFLLKRRLTSRAVALRKASSRSSLLSEVKPRIHVYKNTLNTIQNPLDWMRCEAMSLASDMAKRWSKKHRKRTSCTLRMICRETRAGRQSRGGIGGAGKRTRTSMPFRALPPQGSVSASFTIPACAEYSRGDTPWQERPLGVCGTFVLG